MTVLRRHANAGLLVFFLTAPSAGAQEKQPVTAEDYGRWETLREGALSPDGLWLVYEIGRVNGNDELRLHKLQAEKLNEPFKSAGFGSKPVFSDDSRFMAYRIGVHEDERLRAEKEKKSVRDKMGFVSLDDGTAEVIEHVQTFAFSEGSPHLAIHLYPPEKEDDEEGETLGADLMVRDLSTLRNASFGNVSEFLWQPKGTLLAMIIATESGTGNGIQLFEPSSGVLRVLDSSSSSYQRLAWRKDSDDLVALRTNKDEQDEDEMNIVLAWKNLSSAPERFVYDPSDKSEFPTDARIVEFRALEWAEDGATVFVGIKKWKKVEREEPIEEDDQDEKSNVEIWHAKDLQVIPEQKLRERQFREKNWLAAWQLDSGRFVRLGDDKQIQDVSPVSYSRFAIGLDVNPYERSAMFGRGRRDVYVIDVNSGERKKILEALHGGPQFPDLLLNASSGGRYILYLKDDDYWTYDLETGKHVNLTEDIETSFVNWEDDHPVDQKPPYGIAGWQEGDEAVLIHDKYDLWEVRPDGSGAKRLTEGSQQQIQHRYVKLDPDEEFIDRAKPIYLSLYGEWSKKFGFARLGANSELEQLAWSDSKLRQLTKASDAEIYAYIVENFADSPDYFTAGSDLARPRQVSETNPFQKDYAWGRSELIEYTNHEGDRLQGALFYPAGYQAGKQYPMLVYIYEKRSQDVHNYVVPTERDEYNISVFTGRGYFVLRPDIVFRARDPGTSALDCITSAVNKVLESGMVGSSRLGLIGHSWGGYETSFVSTRSDLFAAAVAGAPLTNFFSMYGSIFWNTGAPETEHFEVGQERMEVPFWEDVDAFIRNSPIFGIQNLKTPLLMSFGDKDGSVDWHQGIEMYNAARRVGKQLVLLVYPGENHHNIRKPNQIDYHRRILEWFDHYLQGAEAPKWITEGVPYLEQQKEKKE